MSRQSPPSLRPAPDSSLFFQSFQKEMDRFLDRFKSGELAPSARASALFGETLFPALDLAETDDAVEITAEVPGVAEDELDVSITGDVLLLKGEKSNDHEEQEKDYHMVERRYGSFRRQVPLGFTPEEGSVEAEFADGILKLRIAKPAKAKAGMQKIKISKA